MSAVPHVNHGRFDHKKTLVSMAENAGVFDALSKEATFGTDTIDIANRIAGLALYNQVNMKTPIIGALPEIDRTQEESIDIRSDSPAATFRAVFNPPAVSGVAGGGSLPTAVTWDTRSPEARPKILSMAIEDDFILSIESRLGHDTVDFETLMNLGRDFMTRSIERDAIARPVQQGGDDYDVDDLTVMLDRVIASEDEETNGVDDTGTSFDGGELDVYDIDRSATGADASNESNWADATVDHNDGTLRQLTGSLMDDFLDSIVDGSSAEYENLVIITGRQTARVLSDLRESQFRADALQGAGTEEVNDAETRLGHNFNARISHWDGVPLVVAPSVPTDSGGLERIYALDPTPGQVTDEDDNPLPKIAIENYRVPDAWRAGPDQPVNPLATGEIKSEAAFAVYHEIVCRDFGAQGKLRDIEE